MALLLPFNLRILLLTVLCSLSLYFRTGGLDLAIIRERLLGIAIAETALVDSSCAIVLPVCIVVSHLHSVFTVNLALPGQ